LIALDTNVLARFYLNDEPRQAQIAARLLMEEDVFIPKTVLLELEWVMRGAARVPPAGIARSMVHLLSLDNVRIEDEAVVRAALKAYAKGVDFADALHAAASAGTSRFVTFDSRLAKRAARALPCPPAVLAQ
jgi:predicted nucleic-acid-binding protein